MSGGGCSDEQDRDEPECGDVEGRLSAEVAVDDVRGGVGGGADGDPGECHQQGVAESAGQEQDCSEPQLEGPDVADEVAS